MKLRWLVPVLGLWGCDTCGDAKAKATPSAGALPGTAPTPAAQPPPPAVAPGPKEHREKAEVEFIGTWSPGAVKAAKVLFVAQAEPCLPVPEKPTRYGETVLKTPGDFFDEYFIPQDSRGHLCLYGYDEAGQVVGAAAWEKNPLRFLGEGEIVFAGINLTLAEVK
jgi:hypothetical protein